MKQQQRQQNAWQECKLFSATLALSKSQFIYIKDEIFKLFKALQEEVSLHFVSKVLHWKINSYS